MRIFIGVRYLRRATKSWMFLMARRPQVALMIETAGAYGRYLLEGIARYQRFNRRWSIFLERREIDSVEPRWLETWHGDGMLSRWSSPRVVERLAELRRPRSTSVAGEVHSASRESTATTKPLAGLRLSTSWSGAYVSSATVVSQASFGRPVAETASSEPWPKQAYGARFMSCPGRDWALGRLMPTNNPSRFGWSRCTGRLGSWLVMICLELRSLMDAGQSA